MFLILIVIVITIVIVLVIVIMSGCRVAGAKMVKLCGFASSSNMSCDLVFLVLKQAQV